MRDGERVRVVTYYFADKNDVMKVTRNATTQNIPEPVGLPKLLGLSGLLGLLGLLRLLELLKLLRLLV
jgi:hypothetical protein